MADTVEPYTPPPPAVAVPAHAHPVHGMLAAFPLAFFTAALVTDIAYANSANMQWANFSVWLIAGGVVMALAAAVAGIVDAIVTRRSGRSTVRRHSSLHTILTIVMLVFAVINGFVHSRDAWTSVVPTGLILSAITALLVIVTSWIGYSMIGGAVRQGVK